jgi:hypothetical protein
MVLRSAVWDCRRVRKTIRLEFGAKSGGAAHFARSRQTRIPPPAAHNPVGVASGYVQERMSGPPRWATGKGSHYIVAPGISPFLCRGPFLRCRLSVAERRPLLHFHLTRRQRRCSTDADRSADPEYYQMYQFQESCLAHHPQTLPRRQFRGERLSTIDLCCLMTRENLYCSAGRFFLIAGFENLKASLNSI